MSITHQEARRLIQFNTDNALQANEKSQLAAHLESCMECRNYASSLHELEFILRPMFHKRWDQNPLPFSAAAFRERKESKLTKQIVLATRITAMGLICMAFLFNIWQFTRSSGTGSGQPSANAFPAPTPSVQFTSTMGSDPNCDQILYTVQKTDTLESIARKFSIPMEDLLATNNLNAANLRPSTQLHIPVCGSTPAGAATTITTTFTPLQGPTTSTPVNGPTQ